MSSIGKKFTLISGDGVKFEVDEAVVMQSVTLRHLIEQVKDINIIPVRKLMGKTLSKVIVYCQMHACADDRSVAEEIKAWDAEFVKVDLGTVYDLLMAAHYLNITDLLDLMVQTVADMVKGKTTGQIRTLFGIKSDLTPKEKEQIHRANTLMLMWQADNEKASEADDETASKVDDEAVSKDDDETAPKRLRQ